MRGLTEAEIGKVYDWSQQSVSLYLEIPTYPANIQRFLTIHLVKFTMAHARMIVREIKDPVLQLQVANRVIMEDLSVREMEAAIKTLLGERRKKEEQGRRKELLFGALDFALRRGAFKAEECRRKGDDGYCLGWRWLEEPVELGEGLPWFEVNQYEGTWYAKASSEFCAFCEKFKWEMDADWERHTRALTLIATLHGSAKRDTCIHQTNGPCGLLEAFFDMLKESSEELDERWLSTILNYHCAICDKYSRPSPES